MKKIIRKNILGIGSSDSDDLAEESDDSQPSQPEIAHESNPELEQNLGQENLIIANPENNTTTMEELKKKHKALSTILTGA